MSEVASETPSSSTGAEDPETVHASPLRVIGLLFAFMACAAAVTYLLWPKATDLDPVETLGTMFSSVTAAAPEPAPEGAFRARGQTVVTLGAAPDLSLDSVTFVRYPSSRARDVMNDQVLGLSFETSSKGGFGGGGRGGGGRGRGGGGPSGGGWGGDSKGKPKLQDAGPLPWHGYETRYARLRHSGGGGKGDGGEGSFYETMRVILTTKTQCLIGYLRFEPGVVGTRDAAEELLAQFVPLEEN